MLFTPDRRGFVLTYTSAVAQVTNLNVLLIFGMCNISTFLLMKALYVPVA